MFLDKFEYALKSLMHAHLRTILTVLGVVVGVAALLTLLSIAFGLERSIIKELDKFGANNAIITPGSAGTQPRPAARRPDPAGRSLSLASHQARNAGTGPGHRRLPLEHRLPVGRPGSDPHFCRVQTICRYTFPT